MMMIRKVKKKFFSFWKHKGNEIDPEEIFLDSHNLPQFDTAQLEGRIVRPLEKSAFVVVSVILGACALFFVGRLFQLQVQRGPQLAERSAKNNLEHTVLFAHRGIIKDRNGFLLAWNEPRVGADFAERRYATTSGISVVVGYVSYPKKDASGIYYDTAIVGKDGIEKYFDPVLAGRNGTMITEENALGEVESQSTLEAPKDGDTVVLSIDARINKVLFEALQELAQSRGFTAGTGALMDVHTGEVLALTSYPEYNQEIMSSGSNPRQISEWLRDSSRPFLDRAVSGLYIPGSIMKPFFALGALEERVVTPQTSFYSSGEFRVPNPYNPSQPTIFKDWKAHGWVDMRRALAVSSNVYFFSVGGGVGNEQKGIGISGIEKYARMFGFGEPTGIEFDEEPSGTVPSPSWKTKTFPSDPEWRRGDTYNSSIGQYGFLVTPMQALRAVSALATGELLTPTLLRQGEDNKAIWKDMKERGEDTKRVSEDISIAREYMQVVREGMRQAVLEGTAKALDVPFVQVAAKTGTAELGVTKQRVNSWVMGYWPYQSPRYAFVITMEDGSRTNVFGASGAMRHVLEWISIYAPEYISQE